VMAMTEPQRRQKRGALDAANAVRFRRAALLAALRSDELEFTEEVLTDPAVASMYVERLLASVPYLAPRSRRHETERRVWVDRAMREAGCGPLKKVGGLTDRQRRALVDFDRPAKRARASDG
jgi:hypothetical protein